MPTKTSKNNEDLPERIYVYLEIDTDGSNYLLAYRSIDEIPNDENNILVGVYDKQNVGKLMTERVLNF